MRVDQVVSYLGCSKGWVAKQALAACLDQEDAHSRLTRAALADVDAGRVIAHQLVKVWADSLSVDKAVEVPSCL